MTADTLAPCVARSSVAVILAYWNNKSWSSRRKDFNYLHLISVEEWHYKLFPIRILARNGLTLTTIPTCPRKKPQHRQIQLWSRPSYMSTCFIVINLPNLGGLQYNISAETHYQYKFREIAFIRIIIFNSPVVLIFAWYIQREWQ